jgi:hypothetical protein
MLLSRSPTSWEGSRDGRDGSMLPAVSNNPVLRQTTSYGVLFLCQTLIYRAGVQGPFFRLSALLLETKSFAFFVVVCIPISKF